MLESFQQLLQVITGGNTILYHAVSGVIIALLVITSGKIVKWLLSTIGKKIIARTETEVDDQILEIVNSRVIALSSVIGIYLGMLQLRLGLTKQNENFISFLEYANTALYLITVLIVASVIVRIVRTVTVDLIHRVTARNRQDQFDKSLIPLINRINTFLIVAFTAILVLEHFGQSVTSLLTILGAGSLALGLAAQDTISNMISGFIIMVDRPFRVGDRVKIPSGESGDVFEIGLRSTKILDFDNNVVIVPNNDLVKTRIINYSYPDPEIRVTVDVTVAYGSDINVVKSILLNVARSHPDVLSRPEPEANFMKFGDFGLHFTLFCRVANFKSQFPTAESMRIDIYTELQKAKIEIPYPHHVVFNKFESSDALHSIAKRKKISRKDH
ncbi:MAG: mechanosensitive ion channel domain-containing protein [Bacteroidota bacterium]